MNDRHNAGPGTHIGRGFGKHRNASQGGSAYALVRVLGRHYDGIEYRGSHQSLVEELARHAKVPAWNGLTDEVPLTQILADQRQRQQQRRHHHADRDRKADQAMVHVGQQGREDETDSDNFKHAGCDASDFDAEN
jgi:ornithine carbamoyltransferase